MNKRKVNTDPYLHKKVIDIPLYNGKLIIILSNSKEKISKYIEIEGDIPWGHVVCDNYNGLQGYFVILNFDHPNFEMTHNVVAHEGFHAMMDLAENRDFRNPFKDHEPYAYLLGWMVDEIYKFMKKNNFKCKE